MGTMSAMKESGEWDLLTYIAGVSGSCWGTSTKSGHDLFLMHCTDVLNPKLSHVSPTPFPFVQTIRSKTASLTFATPAAYYTWAELKISRAISHFRHNSKRHPLLPKTIHRVLRSPDGPLHTFGSISLKHAAGLQSRAMDVSLSFRPFSVTICELILFVRRNAAIWRFPDGRSVVAIRKGGEGGLE
jgi:hypothetical protein